MRQLAIIKDIHFGNRDVGQPCVWFTSMINEGTGALQVLMEEDLISFVKDSGCHKLEDLEGKPCWVDVDGSRILFEEVAKI